MFPFFLFMLFCTLLLPATMLFFGRRWQISPPKEINGAYGYRTRRSMSGRAAWDFAHRWIGQRFCRAGWVTLAFTVIWMAALAAFAPDITSVAGLSTLLIVLQFIPVLMSSVSTEQALKREFEI